MLRKQIISRKDPDARRGRSLKSTSFTVKKTGELTPIERVQLVSLYNRTLSVTVEVEAYFSKYYWTSGDGSYHSLWMEDGEVVGCYNVIPYEYDYFGRTVFFGLAVALFMVSFQVKRCELCQF